MTKSLPTNSVDEIFKSLSHDQTCKSLPISDHVMDTILYRYRDDWKSALGIFKLVRSLPHYKPSQKLHDIMIDILGKAKSFDSMKELLEEMRQDNNVTLHTIAKVMRRLSGAGKWEDAVKVFDELTTFGLEKNTESMNLLLDLNISMIMIFCHNKLEEKALEVLGELEDSASCRPDAQSFYPFIKLCLRNRKLDLLRILLDKMVNKHLIRFNLATYKLLIHGLCRADECEWAYQLFEEMISKDIMPSQLTFQLLLDDAAERIEVFMKQK
ncbi:pentatricopeptide repeat-containing protein At3g04130, mitochondrial-like [Impatiens glandulifera]|uniref:pentatricopeptide repeat-containing protein At3g04130, mitochondrial-like n=1 Tax=Impatiens glandulifera TaxID=253017 RepID=UPI001FB0ECBF|nr:pentatricopeptide repeat-containing protein At3g04130, mitochondrial-like [Impatiens glandulifera]